MSRPSPLTSQDSGQIALEEKQEEVSVVISPDPINFVTVDRAGCGGKSSIRKDEPIVTRRELWSYYRKSYFFSLVELRCLISKFLSKCTTTEIMYANFIFASQNLIKVLSNEGGWAKRIYYDFIPIVSQRSRIRPCKRARFVMQRKQCIRPMCSSLGWRHQSRLQRHLNRQWSELRCKLDFNSISVVDHHLSLQRSWLYYSRQLAQPLITDHSVVGFCL